MTTTVIQNSPTYPYGQMTNQTIGRLLSMNTTMARLKDAIANAASGYTGIAGTEFEVRSAGAMAQNTAGIPTLFGVVPSDTPGEQGASYRYAMDSLAVAWESFWTTAEPFINQLDNGSPSM